MYCVTGPEKLSPRINSSCNIDFSGNLPELMNPVTLNFQVIPEIVCRRLSPSLLSMWGALVLVNQVKGPNQVRLNQVIN